MSIPRSASKSSTSRRDSGYLTYIITASRITSGELLKQRNGFGGLALDFRLIGRATIAGQHLPHWSDNADKGYDADAIREEIGAAGVEAVIPAKSNRRVPIPQDREKCRWRNLVERLFSKLKNWRRVATRYDKTKESYLGFVALASIKLWIPFVHVA